MLTLRFSPFTFSLVVYPLGLLYLAFGLPLRLLRKVNPTAAIRPHTVFESMFILGITGLAIAGHVAAHEKNSGSWDFAGSGILALLTLATSVTGFVVAMQRTYSLLSSGLDSAKTANLFYSLLPLDRYVSAFETLLPKADAKPELSHQMPFLLAAICERRKRHLDSAKYFQAAIIVFGIIFVVIIAIYGFITLDAIPVGIERRITTAEKGLNEFTRVFYERATISIGRLQSDLAVLTQTKQEDRISLNALPQQVEGVSNHIATILNAEVNSSASVAQMNDLFSKFSTAIFSVRHALGDRTINSIEQTNVLRYLSRSSEIARHLEEDFRVYFKANSLADQFQKQLDALVKEERESPWQGIGKRLSIGLIAITFFFAVLRYLNHQYATHLLHVARADDEETLVRKFFAAALSTKDDKGTLACLEPFIKGGTSTTPLAAPSGGGISGMSEAELKFLKELAEMFQKKASAPGS